MMSESGSSENIIDFVKALQSQGVPEKEYYNLIERFLDSKARQRRIPLHGSFELTPLCNLDCKMCYVHLNSAQFSVDNLLNVNDWKDIIHEAHGFGMRSAGLTGGECLTYPGFEELYIYLKSLRINVSLLTNGILLDKRRVAFFERYRPKLIRVTLYGGSNDCYESVTGHRVFDIVYNNLVLIRDAGLPLTIAITPNPFMKNEEIYELYKKLDDIGVPYNINKMLMKPRSNTGRDITDMTAEEYIEFHRIRWELNNRQIIPVDPVEIPDIMGKEQVYGLRCGAGRSSCSVKYDGSMVGCFGLDEFSVMPMKEGFQNAWKKLNDYAENYPYPQECNGCAIFEECHPCPAMHKNAPIFGHCDPAECEKTRKYICAGLLSLKERN